MKDSEYIIEHPGGHQGSDDRGSRLEFLVSILSRMDSAMAIVDGRGIIGYANAVFLELFKISGEQFRGENIGDFICSDTAPLVRILSRNFIELKETYDLELKGRRRDSSEFDFRCGIIPLSTTTAPAFLMTITDLSEDRESEEKIGHLENLASIGTFASGVAHEFNNVLTGIKGYAQLARIDPDNRDLTRKAFAIIEEECLRGAELCRNMSLYSTRLKINPEPVELHRLVDTVIALQNRFFIQENIEVVREVQELPPILADKNQIQQVLLNLIVNARHAIIPRGHGTIRIRILELKRYITIEVEDNGIGIDEKSRNRIFDPFFTSKGPTGMNLAGKEIKGTGLGLAVSTSIIKKHRGTISVKSTVGQGSTFTIRLPKKYTEKKETVETGGTFRRPTPQNLPLKVLIVDDELSVREVLFKAMASVHIDPSLARNAEEALALCRSEKFDIIFLDYILPEMTGERLIPLIKEVAAESKIVIISGWTSSPMKKKNIERTVSGWIDKPFDMSDIFNCIDELTDSSVKH